MPYASKLKAVVKIFPSGAELSEVPVSTKKPLLP